MKVTDSENKLQAFSNVPVKDEARTPRDDLMGFRSQLMKAEGQSYERHLEKLAEDIIIQGERLSKKVDVKEFMAYKRLISEFLDSALGKSLKFSKRSLLDRKGRHKVYALIRRINDEVDKLAREVMDGEKENLHLLERMDDIRGLILDMLI